VTRLVARAYAKVNLCLKVLGSRSDGYHEIHTVLQSVSLHDRLEMSLEGTGVALIVDDPDVPDGPDNLVLKAVDRLGRGRWGSRQPNLRIRLSKRIPSGAGLGGGSSDAAAALIGLDRLLGLDTGAGPLLEHAAALGSDVPYFLSGGTAILTGRGTEVTPLPDIAPAELLILHSGKALSTAAVYAQLQEPLTLAAKPDSISRFGRVPMDLMSWMRAGNDLEPAATRLCADVRRMRDLLDGAGAVASAMTGSGSAVFGLFATEDAARAAGKVAESAGFKAFPCRTLDRESFHQGRLLT
jgi:4-diphosphocytidyl-2-C-methyl-D-erythritol kinase